MSIRFKVIFPYLLLTLLVAVTGAYIVTRLVSNSLDERLKNQLVEAGRVVSDSMAQQERKLVDAALLISHVKGLDEAISAGENAQVSTLTMSASVRSSDVESVLVFNAQGQESNHLIRQSDGKFQNVSQPGRLSALSIVDELLKENDPDSPPKRVLAIDPTDGRYYYFTAIPFISDDRVLGVIVVGRSLNTLLPYLKSVSLADVILYNESGRSIASTLALQDNLYQHTISISPEQYGSIINNNKVVQGINIKVGGRSYSIAYGPFQIGNDRLAVFSVVLRGDFVADTGSLSRWNYVFLYGAAMIGVIMIGYFVSRLIIVPLLKLVRTSRIIASGDLTKRTEIKRNDEIGVLASTFDEMTDHLQQRTLELERSNKLLEQMDAAKTRFIQVAAHELRTPLTLVQGYAQMVEVKAKQNNEYTKYTNGILEGTTRMVEVIDNMLDVSRIDSNLLDVLPVEIQIVEVIEKVNKTFESALEERTLTFKREGLESLPAIIGDKDLLYKLFYHVIVNAIKYTPDGGCITVSGRKADDSQIEVAVQDTGIGVDPQNHELVFEKFYQTGEVLLHSSGKTKFKGGGPGLGLAIARGIVNAHHGRIWLESPGFNEATLPGTTVYVRLPVDGHFNARN